MRKRNVVISTLSQEAFEDVVNKLENLEVDIVEKRYDLLYKRYEIYARTNLRQSYTLRRFIKSYRPLIKLIEV